MPDIKITISDNNKLSFDKKISSLESVMSKKVEKLDNKISSSLRDLSNKVDKISSAPSKDKINEIRDLIARNSKTLMNKIDDNHKEYKSKMNENKSEMKNMLKEAFSKRLPTKTYNNTVVKGPGYMPYAA